MHIEPDETDIMGLWLLEDGRMVSNAACKRVQSLIATHLRPIASAWNGPERLFHDAEDGRYWELSYPFGATQAAGPPTLRAVDPAAVQHRYSQTGR